MGVAFGRLEASTFNEAQLFFREALLRKLKMDNGERFFSLEVGVARSRTD
jgi:hypothetical protein